MAGVAGKMARCLNETALLNKIITLKEDGCSNLQVIADFDFTMTQYHPSGTCFGVIRTYPGFPEEFLRETEKIKNKHMPIHVDFTLPEEVRKQSDHEWFMKITEAFKAQKFKKSLLGDMIDKSSCRFRDGVPEFLSILKKNDIPVLIFSGGIGDIIEEMLNRENCRYDNIKILANKFVYDDGGVMVGVEEPVITGSSKLEVAASYPYFKEVRRKNVLLFGDMLSDLKMSTFSAAQNVLTVGFCNDQTQESKFLENFDIILLEQMQFEGANRILKACV